jgi:hypothetical protein
VVIDLRWNRGGDTFLAPALLGLILGADLDRVFLLVGRRTFSAAGNTASQPQWFAGPHLTVYWQGMTPLDRRGWIPPDVYTPPTFAAYRENRDPAMEAVLATLVCQATTVTRSAGGGARFGFAVR